MKVQSPMLERSSLLKSAKKSAKFASLLAITLAASLAPVQALAATPLAQAPPAQAAADSLSNDQIVQRIDAAVKARIDSISSYTVQELYSIYRNGETNPSAQVTVKTVYTRNAGKEYTTLSETGSSLLRAQVIGKVLSNEKEMAKAANRESVAVTSANYDMQPDPSGHTTIRGRDCIAMTLKPKRKATYLFNGKGWFDSADFTLVRLEGSPSQSVSMFAGDAAGKRDYDRIEGFSMAQHAEMKTHNMLLGDTLMTIDYTNYQIQHDNKAATSATN